jgi:hypothetical protein
MPMAERVKRRIWPAVVAGVLICLGAGACAIELLIHAQVVHMGRRAEEMFGDDRVDALIRVVDCESCETHLRSRAVWALGQMEEARALPALRSHLTGRKCDHERGLCQYELDKAIRKIEGTFSVIQRLRPARKNAS